ncbi:MAG TPA: CehA/McbA family metallohydrolase, partial [Vicinamibacterales bacterium]|nr:CehA/McbA family metallohydrolase [Vicinamibacterales bacterium]
LFAAAAGLGLVVSLSAQAASDLQAPKVAIPMQGGAQQQATRGGAVPYRAAKTGGNYMHNFYFPPAVSSTPWWPSWSPDGTWIAVAMGGSIWRVDPATGRANELTAGPTYHSSPDISPDGRWLVYTADHDGQTIQLEMLNLATGTTAALTSDTHIYTDPVFSPDGTRLAYVSTAPSGYFNVYIRAIKDGQWSGPEVAVTTDHAFGNDRLYFGDYDVHVSPTWMPDGTELLLVSNRNVALGSGNVYRVPARAKGMEDAQVVRAEQTLFRPRPDVSIDGKRFVYASTSGAADQYNNLYVQPTVGGEPYKLTFFRHDAFHPRWSPDGEWIAYISNEGGLPQLALLETYGGAQRTVHITERRFKRPVGTLSVRVVDDATGQVIGARTHLTAADGKQYVPTDAYARVSGIGDRIFHTDGTFTVDVPVGTVRMTTVAGFERMVETTSAEVRANEVTLVTVRMKGLTDLAASGWFNGSTHVHMNYAGNLHNTLENLLMMSAAEDQDIVNEQVANKDNRILDYQYFVKGGGPHPLSTPDRVLVVGQEYRPPFYGHVFMFGMRDHLISPFTTGYEGTAIESLYPSNTDMFRKAKAQGATVGYVHAFGGEGDPLDSGLGGGKGFMVDAALGTTDAVEWSGAGRGSFLPWYATLNNGFKVTAVGGEDSISSMHASKLVGAARTYVYTGDQGLTMDAWFAGLRAGRAFVTTGPLVMLQVNGSGPGEELRLPVGGGEVTLTGWVKSITPLQEALVVFNGEVVERIPFTGNRTSLTFARTLKVTRSGWYHLRAEGAPADRFPLDADYAQGFTNPVWISVGGAPVRSTAAAGYSIKWIDALREMAEAWPGWRSQKERDHVFAQFDEAKAIYQQRAAEAAQ